MYGSKMVEIGQNKFSFVSRKFKKYFSSRPSLLFVGELLYTKRFITLDNLCIFYTSSPYTRCFQKFIGLMDFYMSESSHILGRFRYFIADTWAMFQIYYSELSLQKIYISFVFLRYLSIDIRF